MSNGQNTGVNKLLLLSVLLLICLGIVVVYTASTANAMRYGLNPEFYLKRHSTMVVIALGAMLVGAKLDYSFWKKFARVIFWLGCASTLATLVLGREINGAHRWLTLPFLGDVQPSELLKFGLITMVASKLSDAGAEIKTLKCGIVQPCIFLGIAAVCLALQPNFSMLILFSLVVFSMLLTAGVQLKYLGRLAGGGVAALSVALLALPHTRARILAFFDSSEHTASSMQSDHALEALGNGGWFGTGIGKGVQKMGYLPEAHKDVVYSVIGEEMGFLGTSVVLALFGVLFYQGFEIARNSSTRFGKYLAVALTFSLFLNFLIHVCVSTKLGPTTGQPLPFLSYGGTNLILSSLFIGILLNISKPGTGKSINEPYVGGDKTNVYTFGGFDVARTET